MNRLKLKLLFIISLSIFSVSVSAQGVGDLRWETGPKESYIGDKAKITVPDGYVFLGAEDTAKFMEMNQNLPSGNEYLFAPDDLRWFAVFEFDPVGYVKDNETLDSQSLLDTVIEGTKQGNIERRKRGWGTMTILGWKSQPRYDGNTNLLEWAFLAKSDADSSQIINYNTRLLGRSGVMTVVLVAEPNVLDASVAEFKRAINGYRYMAGEKYTEYRKGDRVAQFGLAALIAGGAAAVATKKGLWAVLAGFFATAWKFIAVAFFGLLAWIKSLFKSK